MNKKFAVFTSLLCFCVLSSNAQNTFENNGENVGIGTSSPDFKLVINSEVPYLKIRSSKYTINPEILTKKGGIIFNQENGDKTAAILEAIPPGYHVPGILFSTKLSWDLPGPGSTDWYDRMFIHPNGNVGIGTTEPSDKLSVNGNIRAKEIKVEAGNWPDYVFTLEHKRPTLSELEDFIQKNRHLPGIPSASEVKDNGVNLGEMNTALLKKVEELTLYIIEQNKKLEGVIQQNYKQQEKLRKLEETR